MPLVLGCVMLTMLRFFHTPQFVEGSLVLYSLDKLVCRFMRLADFALSDSLIQYKTNIKFAQSSYATVFAIGFWYPEHLCPHIYAQQYMLLRVSKPESPTHTCCKQDPA